MGDDDRFGGREGGQLFGQDRDDDIFGFKMSRVDQAKAEGPCKQQIMMLYIGGDKGVCAGFKGGGNEILPCAAAKGNLGYFLAA